jgi:serine/threonine protein kinase
LIALTLGDLPEADAEDVIGHLEICPQCEAAARALDNQSDSLLISIRHSAATQMVSGARGSPPQIAAYAILGELGRGSRGVVYQARDTRRGRVVALKVFAGARFLDADERRRFRAAVEATACLQHPHIVPLVEVGECAEDSAPRRLYVARELVDGSSLAERMMDRPPFPRQAAVWLEALARAAHYAHQQGITHRALKPSNVLLTRAGQLRISDFGVAEVRGEPVTGVAAYLAPEQTISQSTAAPDAGPAADVYALGALLYILVTGRPPFQGANRQEILEQVRLAEPAPPHCFQPQLPRDLETICLQCLQKVPSQRYPSAADLADDLHRFLSGQPIVARRVGGLRRFWRWWRR